MTDNYFSNNFRFQMTFASEKVLIQNGNNLTFYSFQFITMLNFIIYFVHFHEIYTERVRIKHFNSKTTMRSTEGSTA